MNFRLGELFCGSRRIWREGRLRLWDQRLQTSLYSAQKPGLPESGIMVFLV
jgi:hypothetical protein